MNSDSGTTLENAVMDGAWQAGLLPTADIQADLFKKRGEAWDGRGVTVAIFDTGVDPGAVGLQTTPDGRPKVVDLVDATGSGDVDMSRVVEATIVNDSSNAELHGLRQIAGLSGRQVVLGDDKKNPAWSNPSGKWHVGIKAAFELFPKSLKNRVKKERKKVFDKEQRAAKQKAVVAFF
jgi:tripeptidyl-peptidase-2